MGETYTLQIANLNKTIFIVVLTIFSAPLLFLISLSIENPFLKQYNLVLFFLLSSISIVWFLIWIFRKSKSDAFKITSLGIVSQRNGIIKWHEIENCSLETISHSTFVYIKKKNKSRYAITASFAKNKALKENDIWNFFDEIKLKRAELDKTEQFKISENRLTNSYMVSGIVLLVGTFIVFIAYNLFIK